MERDAGLNRVLRRLILRSFPTLRRRTIAIGWGPEDQDELLYYAAAGEQYRIVVHPCFEAAPRRALEGGIAHELCHMEADLRLGRYPRQLAWERYARSSWYRTRNERTTERRAIELGYGAHLLELIRFARKLGYTFEREHGLFYAEIVREVGRWKVSNGPRCRAE